MTGKDGDLTLVCALKLEIDLTHPGERSKDGDGLDKVVEDAQSVTASNEVSETHESSSKHESNPSRQLLC